MSEWPPRRALCVGTVVLKDEKVLFVRQAKGTSLAGQWSIPWGLVEAHETPEAAALRETREEGGIIANIEGLLGIQNLEWQSAIGIIFLCRHVTGTPQSDGGVETDRADYLSSDEIIKMGKLIEPWCHWIALRVLKGQYHLIPKESTNPYHPLTAFF